MTSSAPQEPVARAAHAAPARSHSRFNPGWGLVIAGGVLGVLGAFMTWATVDYGGVASHTYRGVSGGRDGKITVVLSVVVLGLTVLALFGWAARRWMRPALTVVGLVIAFVAIADLAASPSVGSEVQAQLHVSVTSSNGVGEWLTLLAGILVVVGVVLVGRYSRGPAPQATVVQHVGVSVPTATESAGTSAGAPISEPSAAEVPEPEPSTAKTVDSETHVPDAGTS
jgi:drug/metabolite transporter (DMT)-like permease